MNRCVVITSCGFIDVTGFGGKLRRVKWDGVGPEKLKWSMVSDTPFERFGRLDPLSKHAVIAAEMLGLPPRQKGLGSPNMAVVLGTGYGCVSVDADFFNSMGQPGGASPSLFLYTLPNIAAAEIAIRYRVAGPNLCMMAGPESGMVALWEGMKLVEEGEAESCICVAADVLPPKAELIASKVPFDRPQTFCFAYAFLLENEIRTKGRTSMPRARILREQDGTNYDERVRGWGEPKRLCRFLMKESKGTIGRLQLCSPRNLGFEEVVVVERLQ